MKRRLLSSSDAEMRSSMMCSSPSVEHISHLYTSIGFGCVFGRSEICRLTDLKERGASKLIDLMLRSRLIDTVKGQGKGKYRFRNFSEEA